ncbi:hypothetical protein HNY73_009688 [Argiope bruennichi]|uniref:Uncharacterized protein n=1 Tax=Argiope bruennichi TaxID=94029 RepID=A0A8T0FCS7_ARGBR|nr:hypothetical protein HNY73_009688 [Argiope bruennichi]
MEFAMKTPPSYSATLTSFQVTSFHRRMSWYISKLPTQKNDPLFAADFLNSDTIFSSRLILDRDQISKIFRKFIICNGKKLLKDLILFEEV